MKKSRESASIGILLIVGTGVLWGTIGPASKQILVESSFDTVAITWLRSAIASPVCLTAAWLVLGRNLFKASNYDRLLMVLFGFVLTLYQWLYLAAVDEIGVSAATLISLCGAPVIVAVISTLLLHEPLSRPLVIALGGAIIGTILLVGAPDTGDLSSTLVGVAYAVGSAAGIATHVIGMRALARRVHPLQPLAIGFTVGAIALAPIALQRGVSFDQPLQSWLLLLYLGLVPSSIAYLLYQRGLRDVPASVASIATMIEPLIAAVLAWVMFNERLGVWGWVGGALLIGSIWFLSKGVSTKLSGNTSASKHRAGASKR